ncbi:hypothetical protein ACSBR1_026997 [Camellia fascicularis]
MELQHFSHHHPLILSDERIENEINCDACDEPITGLTYSCTLCKFNLHKWCSELPRQLHHPPLHPHPLTLSPETFLNEFLCSFCHRSDFGFRYNCSTESCQFNLHVQCASLPNPNRAFQFHDQKTYRLVSSVCTNFDEIESVNYDEPSEKTTRLMEHLSRITQHRSKPFGDEDSPLCYVCGEPCRGPTLQSFDDNDNKTCLHVRCALLPLTIDKKSRHRHQFTLVPPIQEDDDSVEFYCDICEQERDLRKYWVYCCDCKPNLVCHISCANTELTPPVNLFSSCALYVNVIKRIREIRWEIIVSSLNNVSRSLKVGEEFLSKKKVFLEMKEVRLTEREKEKDMKKLSELEHRCHRHPLRLFNEDKNEAILCNGCQQRISGLTYICNKCKFYLHKSCAELPYEIQHTLHQEHPLSLTAQEHEFKCRVCDFDCTGLSFCCEICGFEVELQCASIHDEYNHEGHEHVLSLIRYKHYKNLVLEPPVKIQGKEKVRSGYEPPCNACGDPCEGLAFECFGCKFQLHIKCATAPPSTKLKCHRHSLVLTYSVVENPEEEYVCDACETDRKPNLWVYTCAEGCDFVAHVSCWNLP